MKSIKTSISSRLVALLAGAALFGLISQSALALGTPSNTDISNTASLAYSVGGFAQVPVNSSTSTFKVDNKVNLTVAKAADATILPNATNQVLRFTVTNNGNTAQRYALTTSVNGVPTATMSNVRIYLDNGSTPGALDGTDTLYVNAGTFGDVAADGQLNILVVADQTAPTATSGQTAAYNLIAQTVNAGTLVVTANNSGVANTAGIDVVFADIAGSADGAKDGTHSAFATYTVSITIPTVTKTAALLCDPINGTSFPKNIPGATVQYTITVTNGSGTPVTLTSITDPLNANTTFDPNLVTAASSCATAESAAGSGFKRTSTRAGEAPGTVYYTTTGGDADAGDATTTPGTAKIDFVKALPVIAGHAAGQLLPAETATVIFNVTIN